MRTFAETFRSQTVRILFPVMYMEQFMGTFLQYAVFVKIDQGWVITGTFDDGGFIRFIHALSPILFDTAITKRLTGTTDTSVRACQHLYKIEIFLSTLNLTDQGMCFHRTIYHPNKE